MANQNVATTPVDTILGGLPLPRRTRIPHAPGGVLIERRSGPAHGRDEAMLDHHYLLSWEQAPVVTEQAYTGRQSHRITKRPGTMSLGLAGNLVPVRFHTRFQLIACLLDPVEVKTLMDEAERPSREPLHPHLLSEDKALATLVRLLVEESETDGASGRLYGDSLATAITSRFVANAQMVPVASIGATSPLPTARLRRVIDRMGADLSDDLSLDTLALESGYSRAHFLRMFKVATGSTPHRFLLEMRLVFAQGRLASSSQSITEVAYAAGFSSHSHLTKVFGARFGVTPSEYRRNA